MKTLVLGDLHFMTSNILESEALIERVEEFLDENRQIERVVLLGDVQHFHEKLYSTPFNNLCKFLNILREYCPVVILVGNHDMYYNEVFLTDDHCLNSFKNCDKITIVDKPIKIGTDIFMPYVYPGRMFEALNTIKDWKSASVIFAHQEVAGCKMGAIISVDGDIYPETGVPFLVSGHIHLHHRPQSNVYYPGSPLCHAFGENAHPIIAVIDTQTLKIDEYKLKLPRKKLLYVNLEDFTEIEKPEDDQMQIKVFVKCTYDQFKALKRTEHYKLLSSCGVKITYKDSTLQPVADEHKQIEASNISDILHGMVDKSKDPVLTAVYERVVFGKKTKPEDIIFC